MKEKTIVSTVTLIASLSAYFYAREVGKDAVPYVMVAGVAGALIGEFAAGFICTRERDKEED